MLRKLLKYDLKNLFKFLSIFYILTLFFGILTRVFLGFENSFILLVIGKICNGVMIAGFFNILINTIMRCWVRFKNSMYGDESYLTHTLPVDAKTLYLSKMITALIGTFASVLVIILTLLVAYYSKDCVEFIKNIVLPLKDLYGSDLLLVIIAFVFIVFVEFVNLLQTGFTGILIGYKMNNMKILFSVIFGFITHMVCQVFIVLALLVYGLFDKNIMNMFITNKTPGIEFIKSFLIFGIIIYLAILIIQYFVNQRILSKGVNVE